MFTALVIVIVAGVPTQKACDKGDGAACFELARQQVDGAPAKAFALFEKGCKAKSYAACGRAGAMLSRGVGLPADQKKGRALLIKACDHDDGPACNDLGTDASEGKNGAPKDFAAAQTFYEKGCQHGSGTGCFNLGNVFRIGEGVPVDLKKALGWFTLACDQGTAMGCTEAAIIHYEGGVGPKDPGKAFELFEKACSLGSQVSCRNLEVLKGKKP